MAARSLYTLELVTGSQRVRKPLAREDRVEKAEEDKIKGVLR
jgi:hypothetical protein